MANFSTFPQNDSNCSHTQNENKLKSIFKVAPIGIGVVKDRVFTDINLRMCEITGYERDEMLGHSSHFLYPDQEEYESAGKEKYRQISEKGTGTVETQFKRKDGEIIDVLLSSTPLDSSDLSKGVTFTVLDITESKRAEKELQDREQKFKAIYDNAPLPYQSLDENGCFIDVNPMWLKTLGYEKEEVIGKSFEYILHPDWKPVFNTNFPKLKRNGHIEDAQFKIKHKNGYHLFISLEGTVGYQPDGTFKQTYCVFKDITEQRKAEEKIRRSEEKFKTIFENANDAIVVGTMDGQLLEVNRMAYEQLGYTKEELLQMRTGELNVFEDEADVNERFDNLLRTGHVKFQKEYLRKDGATIPAETSLQLIDYQGRKAVLSISRDITEQKRAEEEIRKSEEKFKTLFEQAAAGVAQVAPDGHFLRVNERFGEITGYTPEELIEKSFRDITHHEDLHLDDDYIQKVIAGEIDSFDIEKRYIHKKGHAVWIKLYSNVVRDKDGSTLYAIAVIVDITDKKITEEALAYAKIISDESNRMKSEFLKNVTHELRTPLTAVIGFSDLLLNESNKELDESQRAYADYIHQSGQNLLSIINRMLDYANTEYNSSATLELESVNLKDTIYGTCNMLSLKASKKSIEINTMTDQNLDSIMVDKRKLESILYNLIENAIKFTEDGGSIDVKAKRKDKVVLFSVSDTGIGMEKEKLKTIFEPFRQIDGSLARKYGGTGLGLALVKKLVEMHGGRIEVESEPEKGSNFIFEIPISSR